MDDYDVLIDFPFSVALADGSYLRVLEVNYSTGFPMAKVKRLTEEEYQKILAEGEKDAATG